MKKSKKKSRWNSKRKIFFLAIPLFIGVIILSTIIFSQQMRVKPSIPWELGKTLDIQPTIFFDNPKDESLYQFETNLSKVDINTAGPTEIVILYKDKKYVSSLILEDTVPPTAIATNGVALVGSELDPASLVSDIVDASPVQITFAEKYSFDIEQEYQVEIILTDAFENKTTLKTSVLAVVDTIPPVFVTIPPLYLPVGSSSNNLLLTDTVEVSDNVSVPPKIETLDTVDSSISGEQVITLTATDIAGNQTTAKRIVHVVDETEYLTMTTLQEQSDPQLDALLDEIIAEIITPDMTDDEKMTAIYYWMIRNLSYRTDASEAYLTDIYGNIDTYAKRIIERRVGHCYHYASLAALLTEKIGLETILVQGEGHNVDGSFSLHFWIMVKVDGQWLHFDPLFEVLWDFEYQFLLVNSRTIDGISHSWQTQDYPY